MMISKHVPAISAIAVLAIPTTAVAVKPAQPGADHGKAQAHAKGHAKPKNAVFKGAVVSTDTTAGTVTVHVAKANHWGKTFKDTDVTFTVATVKTSKVA